MDAWIWFHFYSDYSWLHWSWWWDSLFFIYPWDWFTAVRYIYLSVCYFSEKVINFLILVFLAILCCSRFGSFRMCFYLCCFCRFLLECFLVCLACAFVLAFSISVFETDWGDFCGCFGEIGVDADECYFAMYFARSFWCSCWLWASCFFYVRALWLSFYSFWWKVVIWSVLFSLTVI